MDTKIFEMQAQICRVFSHPKRIEIIYLLKEGEKSVTQLCEQMDISQSNVSQHLSLMKKEGIVEVTKEGGNSIYRIANKKVLDACKSMQEVLMERLSTQEDVAKKLK